MQLIMCESCKTKKHIDYYCPVCGHKFNTISKEKDTAMTHKEFCKRLMNGYHVSQIGELVEAVVDCTIERIMRICAEVRNCDSATEFRAACDEISDRVTLLKE